MYNDEFRLASANVNDKVSGHARAHSLALQLILVLSAATVGATNTPTASTCTLSPKCLIGVASTLGFFQTHPQGGAQGWTCTQKWSESVTSNSGPSSIHHRCPESAGIGGAVAYLEPVWQQCLGAVIDAGKKLNATLQLCGRPSKQFMRPHSLHSDLAVVQHGTPCFTGIGAPGDTITVTVTQDGISSARSSAASTRPVAADGYFKVCLATALRPSLRNHTVTFAGHPSGSVATNVGVLVGNVIVCSGQSNVRRPCPCLLADYGPSTRALAPVRH